MSVKVVPNSAGMRALLNSSEVQTFLQTKGQMIASRAAESGGKFEADTQAGKNRAHCHVGTADFTAIRKQAQSNTLLKAVDAGRG
jgi:hypothetical protein